MSDAAAPAPLAGGLLGRVVAVRRDEIGSLLWSFLYFFCLLAAYYTIRPVRDEMAVQFGHERLQWLFTATFLTMVALIPAFGWLASRLPVARLLPSVYGFFAACLVAFHLAMDAGVEARRVAPVFFVWVSVFNLFVVSVFWSFMADLFRVDAAKRLFGFISAGGSLGAVAGPGLTALVAPRIGVANLPLLSAALLGGALVCIAMLLRLARARGAGARFLKAGDGGERPGLWIGVVRIARSPYLAAVAVYLVCYTLLSTLLYFEQTRLVPAAIADPAERTRLFATVDLAVNVLTLGIQFFLTGRLLTRLGVTAMLVALPVLNLAGFAAFGLATTLPVLVAFGVLRRAGEFAITKPTRETLFTVVPKEEKYQAKNVIDTVVHRGGDAASGWVVAGLQAAGLSLSGMAFAGVPVAALWVAIAVYLGRRNEAMQRAQAEARA
ncbi:MAG: MFS transporter [Burkholderiales bacterium]|nr:MFS transporter [Burkholderiales bacterium]